MRVTASRWACFALAAVVACTVSATKMEPPVPGLAFETRLRQLETELRCLVCQNQTLADSNADLAADLRREVRELAVAGQTDEEIRGYLVARYGDFVLYNPPLKTTTWVLWVGPFALLGGGALLWWTILRRRERARPAPPAGDDEIAKNEADKRARARLDGDD